MSGLTQCSVHHRQSLSPAGLPDPASMSVHDSEQQNDMFFHWFRIGKNNFHTDLPVAHRRQTVPACFIYECLMNRYPVRSVTLVNWPGLPATACPRSQFCRSRQRSYGWCYWNEVARRVDVSGLRNISLVLHTRQAENKYNLKMSTGTKTQKNERHAEKFMNIK